MVKVVDRELDMNLKHQTRQKIIEILRLTPGISTAEIKKSLGTSYSTARYHLDHLIKCGFVNQIKGKENYYTENYLTKNAKFSN